ncbi:MAG: FAD-dependent oxidoreductase [Alphaproteobacteria bacterium]|nr:FAD-dependent oxidoreductase [Alphaproteobacteria bacterium]
MRATIAPVSAIIVAPLPCRFPSRRAIRHSAVRLPWNGAAGEGMGEVDVAIIGAGAAGLAAAKRLAYQGLSCAVLEAGRRIGGRALTDASRLGVPFDLGCHWLHSGSLNPFAAIAGALGFDLLTRRRRRLLFAGGRFADAATRASWRAHWRRHSQATRLSAHDVAVAAVTARRSRWTALADYYSTCMNGVEPERAATGDDAAYVDTDENWPVAQGYGALIAAWGADVPVRLNTVVTAIDWGGPGVRLATARGTLDAQAAIVTVSTAVLASERLRFRPALPADKTAAIAALPLGTANRIGIAFDRDVFDASMPGYVHVLDASGDGLVCEVRPFGQRIASAYVAGTRASRLEALGEAAMVDHALHHLAGMFGNAIRRRMVAGIASAWQGERWIGGAYAAARPGESGRRAALARPLARRLFFAGEAMHPEFFSTAHGAYLSGVSAADAALAALGAPSARGPT